MQHEVFDAQHADVAQLDDYVFGSCLRLLGELWFDAAGAPREPPWAEVLALPGARLHLYGKAQARPGRKMGHLTLIGPDAASVRLQALRAAERLGIEAF